VGRLLGLLGLLLLLSAALGLVGLIFWINYHLRAARRAVDLGHNEPATYHLKACLRFGRDQREVLLLSARVARRRNAWR
jgi:hypothetical protein